MKEYVMRTRLAVVGWVVLGWLCSLPSLQAADAAKIGASLQRLGGVTRGICVLLGDAECRQAIALARHTELTLYVQLPTAAEVEAAARAADAAGLYGTRIYVEKGTPARIGMADHVADALWAANNLADLDVREVARVLRPGGKADLGHAFGGADFATGQLVGVDDWSHHYHSPDNNPQSLDKLARAPYLTQFIAEPRYAPAPQAAVSAAGRLFMAFGHVAWHEREEPWLDTLVAVSGYNGTLLWKRPLPTGIMVDRSTMIATPKTLYLADDKSCKLIDAATGDTRGEIVAPAGVTDGTFWKWMALESNVLYALIGPAEEPDAVARWKSPGHGWPWTGISKGYNDPQYRWGFAKTLLAIDPQTKKTLWTHQEDPPIDARSLCMKNGRIYYCSFGHYIVCLDAKTGKPIWRRTAEKDPDVFKAIGPYRPGHGYIGGWKSTVYLKCTDKALYFVGPQVEWLTALSAEDGRVLWKHQAKDLHIVVRDDGLYTIGPQNSTDATKKLDPMTGVVLATYQINRRACTRATGSIDSIFFRAHEGTGRFDVGGGAMQWMSTMRPSCHVGVVVANGHLYWIPWACDCNLQMYGLMGCGPAGDFKFDQPASESERLEKPATATGEPAKFAASPGDWPTYRADNTRAGRSDVEVPEQMKPLWRFEPKAAVEPTAPVAAGGLVFFGGSDGVVRAIDAASGKPAWTAYTGGGVRFPPTIAAGRALVGSDDGWVYAFEAANGKMLWRFRAAPAERRIPVFGALRSTWPVSTGVLVDKDTAYFAAGMTDTDGTHVYALDAATGAIRWQNNTCGHLDQVSRRGVACQGEMLLSDGRLYLAGGNSVGAAAFDAATGRCLNQSPTGIGARAPRGRELTLVGATVNVSGQPFYSQPGAPVYDKSVEWQPMRVQAKNVEVTCPRLATDKGPQTKLMLRKPGSDTPAWSHTLPAEPVRWGMAVDAQGRVIVALRNGQVVCFGK
jgi:outer membrane protein assembly factor BamB